MPLTCLRPLLLCLGMLALAARSSALDALPPGAFTIVVIPDTQGYLGRGA